MDPIIIPYLIALVCMYCIGLLTGRLISAKGKKYKDGGVVFVDLSDPKQPYLSLGVSKEQLDEISKKQGVMLFKVVHMKLDSHN